MLNLDKPYIRIGDTALFPLGRLGDDDVYRHRWEVYAFVRDGIIMRRRADGLMRTIAAHWFIRYRTDDSYRVAIADEAFQNREDKRRDGLARIRARRISDATLQTDVSEPGYYVSARHQKQYALLLGPFASHYDALQLVPLGRRLAQPYDRYCEYGYGTCRTETSEKTGRFNGELTS